MNNDRIMTNNRKMIHGFPYKNSGGTDGKDVRLF